MIILVTHERDVTCDLVVLRLRERGVPYLRLNTDAFLIDGGVGWSIDPDTPAAGTLRWRDTIVRLGDISAVWYRRPVVPRPPPTIEHPGARSLAAQEGAALLQNLWSLVPGLWVSPPDAIHRTESKLTQLTCARTLGLAIPPTLLTDNPDEAQAFCRTHDDVIAKPLGRSVIEDPATGERSVVFTNRVRNVDKARLDTVAITPTLFQRAIPKRCDLRVTVVGRRVFATEIHTVGVGEEVDWRRVGIASLHHTPHSLPPGIAERVLALVRGFDLQFGALDFILTPESDYVFLEINPNGQWAWLELVMGTPISSALVDLLSGKAQPL